MERMIEADQTMLLSLQREMVEIKRKTEETIEPSGVQVLKNPNPLKDVEALAVLDVVVLV